MLKSAEFPNQLSPDTIAVVRNSGAGFLADLAKQAEQAGGALELTGEEARDSGAGFVQDVLKRVESEPEPPPVTLPPPVLNSINPSAAPLGGVDVTMNVNGSKFVDGAVIVFNGGDEPTTFKSVNQLSTVVKPSLATVEISVPVWVRNPDGQRTEAEKTFSFAATAVEGQYGNRTRSNQDR